MKNVYAVDKSENGITWEAVSDLDMSFYNADKLASKLWIEGVPVVRVMGWNPADGYWEAAHYA